MGAGPGGSYVFAGGPADTWTYNLDSCQHTPVEAFRDYLRTLKEPKYFAAFAAAFSSSSVFKPINWRT